MVTRWRLPIIAPAAYDSGGFLLLIPAPKTNSTSPLRGVGTGARFSAQEALNWKRIKPTLRLPLSAVIGKWMIQFSPRFPEIGRLKAGQSPENDGVGGFLGRANDSVPDAIRISGAGARAAAHPALGSHRTSHGGMDRAADARSLSVGHRAALPAARSRSDLWPGVREAGEGDGHQTGAVGAAFPVATRLRRAGHRHHPPRVPGSLDGVQRAKSAPAPPGMRGILPSEPRSLGLGERYSGAPTDPAARVWPDRIDTGAGRAASPIRAARRVDLAFLMMPPAGDECPHTVIMPPTWSSAVQNTSAEQISLGKLQSNPQAKPLIGKSRHRQTSPEMMFQNFREPQSQLLPGNHTSVRPCSRGVRPLLSPLTGSTRSRAHPPVSSSPVLGEGPA